MDNAFWQKLFKGFRHEDHKHLMLSTTGGIDVAVYQIARIEEDLVMLRGRLAGTADDFRLFLIPYGHINVVFVNRVVKPLEVELFSPYVSPERKDEVARKLEELEQKSREEAEAAEQAIHQGRGHVSPDLKLQLETLRAKAGFAEKQSTETSSSSSDGERQKPSPPPDKTSDSPSRSPLPLPPNRSQSLRKFKPPKRPGDK